MNPLSDDGNPRLWALYGTFDANGFLFHFRSESCWDGSSAHQSTAPHMQSSLTMKPPRGEWMPPPKELKRNRQKLKKISMNAFISSNYNLSNQLLLLIKSNAILFHATLYKSVWWNYQPTMHAWHFDEWHLILPTESLESNDIFEIIEMSSPK